MILPHNLNEAFNQIFGSNMNAIKEAEPKFANKHQQHIFDYLQQAGWKEMDKFPMHFERKDKSGIIVFEGDDVFILERVYDVPWARVNTIRQMESDLNALPA